MSKLFTKSNLFATPGSIKELQEIADRFVGSEKAVAYMMMAMTWNLAAEVHKEYEETQIQTIAKMVNEMTEDLRIAQEKIEQAEPNKEH
tara:strand:- start:2767 stop:3033 length:267 start_codon:yes stop_codon:yes gene_type:complete